VSIIPDAEAETLGSSRGAEDLYPGCPVEEVEAYIVEFYAGFAADIHFDPASEEEARLGAESDTETADGYLRRLPGDPAENEKRLRLRAAQWVKENWPTIERVAQELLEHRELDFDEIMIISEIYRGEGTDDDLARYRRNRNRSFIEVRRAERGKLA
jgi:hypothetical protein